MNRKMILKALILSIMVVMVSAPYGASQAWAGGGHVADSLEDAQKAEEHGKQGHADVLVENAEEALKHAKMAQKETPNMHLDKGISELEKAISHGKQGHADVATGYAESAIKHLKEVK